ncbi:MAG TPA: hypothetical protein VFU47_02345, partial [Armatimonadota bacterium]|nr:hypothetical protein [Armatimonadota bacterium]
RTFHGRTNADLFGHEKTPVTMSGRWDAGEWDYLAFFPTVLRDILTQQGYQPDAILIGWRDRGWLDCEAGKTSRKVRIGENTPRMVVIRRTAIDGLEPGDTR